MLNYNYFVSRGFVSGINQIWRKLAKIIPKRVQKKGGRYSLIYVPNGYFVNMEHQNEFYYWDTYWIIKGIIWYIGTGIYYYLLYTSFMSSLKFLLGTYFFNVI